MMKSTVTRCLRLAALLCLLVSCFSLTALAKSCPYFSEEKVQMLPCDRLTVTLKNAGGKVKWSTKNNIGVRVDSVTGKNRSKVTLLSGRKTGRCTLTAKVGKNSYRCQVTVKNGTRPGGSYKGKSKSSLVKVLQKGRQLTVRVKLCNGSDKKACWADYVGLQRRVNGKWKTVPYKKGFNGWEEAAAKTVYLPARSVTYADYVLTDYFDQKDLIGGSFRMKILPSYPDYGKYPQDYVKFKMTGWDE